MTLGGAATLAPRLRYSLTERLRRGGSPRQTIEVSFCRRFSSVCWCRTLRDCVPPAVGPPVVPGLVVPRDSGVEGRITRGSGGGWGSAGGGGGIGADCGEEEGCPPGVADGDPGAAKPEPGTTGPDPGTTGSDPGTTGPDPGTTGPVPGTTGLDPGTTGTQSALRGAAATCWVNILGDGGL